MKMVLAIINYDDAQDVINSLMKAGFSITKLATTGGFLKAGNVTILIGLEESKLDACFDIIREHSSSRKQIIPTTAELGMGFFPIHARTGRGRRRDRVRAACRAV